MRRRRRGGILFGEGGIADLPRSELLGECARRDGEKGTISPRYGSCQA